MSIHNNSDFEIETNHYIYKVTDTETGQYYIGVRSCFDDPEDDPYMGSGDWIRGLYKEYGWYLVNAPQGKFVKEIVEICGSRSEAASREQVAIGDRWEADPLCMNKICGGTGFAEGKRHPRYNSTVHDFWDHAEQKRYKLTAYDFTAKYGSHPHLIISEKQRSMGNVVLYKNKALPHKMTYISKQQRKEQLDKTLSLWDIEHQVKVKMTAREFSRKYRRSSSELTSGAKIKIKNLCLYKNRNSKELKKALERYPVTKEPENVYHVYNFMTKTDLYYTPSEFLKKTGLRLDNIIGGKGLITGDYVLGENKMHVKFVEVELRNIETGENFFMSPIVFSRTYGRGLQTLLAGKTARIGNITLPESKLVIEKAELHDLSTGHDFTMTAPEFFNVYGSRLNDLKKGVRTRVGSVILKENKGHKFYEEIEFYNLATDEVFRTSKYSFIREYGYGFNDLIKGNKKVINGITLLENKSLFENDPQWIKHHIWDKSDDSDFWISQYSFRKKYNKSIKKLIDGTAIRTGTFYLYENKQAVLDKKLK